MARQDRDNPKAPTRAAGSGKAGEKPANFLMRRHPAYWELLEHWEFLIATFESGPAWLEKNIFRYLKESKDEHKERVARAYRDNVTRDVVEIHTGHLMKVPANRKHDGAPAPVLEFWESATRGSMAMGVEDFMREVAEKSAAVSPCYVVVDMPAAPVPMSGDLTIAQALELGLRPYAYVVYPPDVLDFGLDEDDEFTWLLLRENIRDDADPIASSGEWITRYRLWTRKGWALYKLTDADKADGYELIAEGEHSLERVPVVPVYHKPGSDRYRAIALTEEIAYKDRSIANNESRLDLIINDQTFSQLFIPDAGLIASTDTTAEGKRQKMVKMGTRRIVLFNDQAKHPPMFLSPDAAQAELILKTIDRQRQQIYEDALLDSELGKQDMGPKTATEAEIGFAKLNAALAERAKHLEACERRLLDLVCRWRGLKLSAAELAELVQYPRKFNVKQLAEELAEAVTLQGFSALGAKFWAAYFERLLPKILEDARPEEIKAMVAEIAENSDLAKLLADGEITEQAGQEPDPEDEED